MSIAHNVFTSPRPPPTPLPRLVYITRTYDIPITDCYQLQIACIAPCITCVSWINVCLLLTKPGGTTFRNIQMSRECTTREGPYWIRDFVRTQWTGNFIRASNGTRGNYWSRNGQRASTRYKCRITTRFPTQCMERVSLHCCPPPPARDNECSNLGQRSLCCATPIIIRPLI